MPAAIEVSNLTKIYNPGGRHPLTALAGVSFEVTQGTIFAVLGLNGAGKTTLVKVLLGLTRMTSGSAFLFGESVGARKFTRRVGYLPEMFKGEKSMTVEQLLRYIGEIGGVKGERLKTKITSLMEEFDLGSISHKKTGKLSKGTLTRLGIAQALIDEPELLFLDEPTDGLDPVWRKNIRELLLKLKNNGTTILLNSHLLSEVEIVADRVAIIQKGEILANGTVNELVKPINGYKVKTTRKPVSTSTYTFLEEDGLWACNVKDSAELESLMRILQSEGLPVLPVEPVRMSLEDIFISTLRKTVDK